MKKLIFTIMILILFMALGNDASAITALEVFNDGTRAFNNGRWQECEEIFIRFGSVWPDHDRRFEALYYQTLAATRTINSKLEKQRQEMAGAWSNALNTLKTDLSSKDFTEIEAAIEFATNGKPQTWKVLDGFSPQQLKHFLSRSWHPDPQQTPIETIQWAYNWSKKHTIDSLAPELVGKISLLKSLAFWQIVISPLSNAANSNILNVCEGWPVHTALEKELRVGFTNGNTDIKRDIALIGYHYEYFKNKGILRPDGPLPTNRWLIYLKERGLNLKEAWCPR